MERRLAFPLRLAVLSAIPPRKVKEGVDANTSAVSWEANPSAALNRV